MTENAPSGNGGKTKAQDLFGILACMLGGFSAVSVFLAMEGQESRNLLARPVEGLMILFGAPAALVVATGLSILGMVMFLGRRPVAAVRHLVGMFAVGLGVALVIGGIRPQQGGLLGSALPEAIPGIPGLVSSFAIGVTVLVAATWIAWIARIGSAGSKPTSLAAVLSPGTSRRQSDGVSVAEARALQGTLPKSHPGNPARSSPKEKAAGPVPLPGAPSKTPDVPVRTQVQASSGAHEPLADGGFHSRAPSPVGEPARPHVASKKEPLPAPRPIDRRPGEARIEAVAAQGSLDEVVPPLPSWETNFEEAGPEGTLEEELETEPTFYEEDEPEELVRSADEADEEGAPESELSEDERGFDSWATGEIEEESNEAESKVGAPAPLATPATSAEAPAEERARDRGARWEQIGLFDEAGAGEHEPTETQRTPSVDAPVETLPEPMESEDREPAYVLTPRAEERTEPSPAGAGDGEEREFDSLTYEAGCLVLEQNRVAVSMLQKRFALDFDQACEVLDRLQGAGLIGPYVGGRSRDILLTRGEWESVAHV